MPLSNFHTHTNFCDGADDPTRYVEAAIRNNFTALGFSAHAPLSFPCKWTLPMEKYNPYLDVIHQLKVQFVNQVEIYCGLEIDYVPELWPETKRIASDGRLDYFIGSIHFVDSYKNGQLWTIDGPNNEFRKGFSEIFQNDYHALIRKYFGYTRQMVKEMKPPIVGHIDKLKMQFDKCFIPEEDEVYREEFYHTLEEIAVSKCIVEVNTRGVYKRNEPEFYPGSWALKAMSELKIPVMINSDAHRPEELANLFDRAIEALKDAGYKDLVTFQNKAYITLDINLLH